MNYLFVIILLLIGYIVFTELEHRKERAKLLDRIMVKSLSELIKPEVSPNKVPTEAIPSPFVEISALPDEEFDKVIREQTGNQTITEKATKKLKSLARK